MLDELPNKIWLKECGIINLDKSSGPGTHWVAYFKDGKTVKYFDSFGNLQPPKQIRRYLGENLQYNYTSFQRYNTYICGHLCLKFLYENAYK